MTLVLESYVYKLGIDTYDFNDGKVSTWLTNQNVEGTEAENNSKHDLSQSFDHDSFHLWHFFQRYHGHYGRTDWNTRKGIG